MKSLYTNYTPIPSQVPRQLAIDILHSHGEVITLNPLVVKYEPMKPPRDAPNDEYYSTWYEIQQQIKFIPGMGKMGTGKVSFKGCFHDMPWGIQTHMYVPMGIDLKHKWEVKGNQPGEPPEPRELGSEAPSTGLYLQESVQIECNPLALSFTKKELKAASKVMVERMLKKAELLDAGVLQAMFEDGKLKTINPNDRSMTAVNTSPSVPAERWRPQSVANRDSQYSRDSMYSQSSYGPPPSQFSMQSSNLPVMAVEMMGDTHFHTPPTQNQHLTPAVAELSAGTPEPNNARWSGPPPPGGSQTSHSSVSRPSSYHPSQVPESAVSPSLQSQPQAHRSPSLTSGPTPPQQYSPYNPQDYAKFNPHT